MFEDICWIAARTPLFVWDLKIHSEAHSEPYFAVHPHCCTLVKPKELIYLYSVQWYIYLCITYILRENISPVNIAKKYRSCCTLQYLYFQKQSLRNKIYALHLQFYIYVYSWNTVIHRNTYSLIEDYIYIENLHKD